MLQVVSGLHLDVELTFERGSAPVVGAHLAPFEFATGGEGAAAVLYHWESRVLEVAFAGLDPETLRRVVGCPAAVGGAGCGHVVSAMCVCATAARAGGHIPSAAKPLDV